MKLTKTDPMTETEVDMTPMIDIVFQLIIFFMLISDMSQKDLEVLVLPPAKTASPDEPNPLDIRPVINIISDGRIFVMGNLLFDPENDDEYAMVREYLARQSARMKKAPLEEGNPASGMVPDDPLLIRADQATPFKHIQKVMELCGLQGIQIWKIQLAAKDIGGEDGEGGGDS